jgi:hypothetical protein
MAIHDLPSADAARGNLIDLGPTPMAAKALEWF